MCGGEKKEWKKKNPNVLGLPVVHWVDMGLGSSKH